MELDTTKIIKEFVDYLMPELIPHEASMYIFLFRNSFLLNGTSSVRIGHRTIAQRYGRGPKMAIASRAHVIRQLKSLDEKGCIRIGDKNRDGTLYEIILPANIPLVIKKLSVRKEEEKEDYYTNPEKRKEIYERDGWCCWYCGEKVTPDNVTLDHFKPQCDGGLPQKENLRTACLLCNSIKSGKSYEEAAPHLLRSIQDRRQKSSKKTPQ